MLVVEPGELDSVEFERQVSAAMTRDLEPAVRSRALGTALELWRGPALADFTYEPFAADEVERLEELRLTAIEERMAADLEMGRHGPLVAELTALVATHDLRERLWWLLMLALYRSARQGEALRAFQKAQKNLDEELGLPPGKALRELEEAILKHDPALDLKPMAAFGEHTDEPPHNLSPAASPLIGRDEDLAAIKTLLATSRLVTLTGPTGVGKSRLALDVAMAEVDNCSDGAWWVSVEDTRTEDGLRAAIVETLRMADEDLMSSERDPTRVVIDSLRHRDLLLWIDGCDMVLGTLRRLAERILIACKSVRLLITSQEHLGLDAESHYQVLPLPLSFEGGSGAPSGPAVELLAVRARAVNPSFEVTEDNADEVGTLLRLLDGLPLAIELAASMMRALTPSDVAEELAKQDRDVSPALRANDRHRSLDTALEWSFARLPDDDQLVLLATSVFEGAWTLADADAISRGLADAYPEGRERRGLLSAVLSLVDKSFITSRSVSTDRWARFDALGTVKRFLRARLSKSGLLNKARWLHARHFAVFAESRQADLVGPGEAEALGDFERARADLYSALAFLTEEGDELAVELAANLANFWLRTGRVGDGVRRITASLSSRPESGHPVARASLLGAILVALDQPVPFGNLRFGHPLVTPRYPGQGPGNGWDHLKIEASFVNRSRQMYLADDHRTGLAQADLVSALVLGVAGRYEESIEQAEASMVALNDLGADWWRSTAALVLANGLLSRSPYSQGDHRASAATERADGLANEALAFFSARRDAFMTVGALEVLARIATVGRDHRRAADLLQRAIVHAELTTERPGRANLLVELGVALMRAGDTAEALEALSDALAISRWLGYENGIGMARCFQGVALGQSGDLATSLELFMEAEEVFARTGVSDWQAFAMTLLGYVRTWLGEQADGEAKLLAALDVLGEQADAAIVGGILEGIAHTAIESGDTHRAVRLLGASDAHLDSVRMTRIPIAEERVAAAYLKATLEIGGAAVADGQRAGHAMTTAAAIRLARG